MLQLIEGKFQETQRNFFLIKAKIRKITLF